MKKIDTEIQDCYILEPTRFKDSRGWFMEKYSSKTFEKYNIQFNVVQENQSKSSKGTIRGLHYQKDPMCQAKLVDCPQGELYDIIVDMRKDSATYGKSIMVLLSKRNRRMVFVPRGCAHGFISLTNNTELHYLVDNLYSKIHEGGINFGDTDLSINEELQKLINELKEKNIEVTLSDKDLAAPLLKDSSVNFYKHYRYLVTGATGQLGYDVVKELNNRGIYDVLALDSKCLDITNKDAVNKIILEYKPEYVINCAAYTAVDKSEEEQETAYAVNVIGPKNLVEACKVIQSKLVHISTDYVFNGKGTDEYKVNDVRNPQNYYGYTKCLGEKEVEEYENSFIVRISWVFGVNGNNFIKTMLKLAETKREISVVNDQIGSPTYTKDVAKFILDLVQTEKYGIYHATNEGTCSWADLAKYVFSVAEKDVIVNGISSSEYKTLVTRPLNSKMSKDGNSGFLPDWKDSVKEYIEEELGYQKTIKK